MDIRYASADAKFSVREVKFIVADVGSLARLPYILSDGHLRELALTEGHRRRPRGEDRFGQRGAADAEAALAAAHATAAEIAANSPLTVRGIKDVLDEQRTDAVAASLRYVAAWNSAFCRGTSKKPSPRCSRSGRRISPGTSPSSRDQPVRLIDAYVGLGTTSDFRHTCWGGD